MECDQSFRHWRFCSAHADAQDWSSEFEVYELASSIEGDAGIGRATGVTVDVDMSDILEVLDIGATAHFEAHNSNGWGVALDYGFMELKADIRRPAEMAQFRSAYNSTIAPPLPGKQAGPVKGPSFFLPESQDDLRRNR